MKDLIKHFFEKVDIMALLVGVVMLGVFFMLVHALINKVIPPENKEIVIHVLGIIEGNVSAIVFFFYGSSKGSQKKDEAMKAKDDIILSKETKPGVQITPEPGTNN